MSKLAEQLKNAGFVESDSAIAKTDDLTDDELPIYCHSHCQTEVAAFHKRHIVRLLKLAGDDEAAESIERSPKEWYHLGERAIFPIVERIRTKQAEERQHQQDEKDKAQAALAIHVL
jgi:hypothetical protein